MRSQLTLGLLALGISNPVLSHYHHHDELRFGRPESVGMLSKPLRQLEANLTAYTHAANYSSFTHGEIHPIEPGSVNMVARDNTIVSYFAVGHSTLYADVNGTYLPKPKRERTKLDTIYDMASLTKIFTTIAALQQLDTGLLVLDATVASYLPEFAVNGKENITIQMLMTHTTGMDADPIPGLYDPQYTSKEQRIEVILSQKLINPPGSKYLYSDLSYMTLMLVLEETTSTPLDELIGELACKLGMKDTFFNRGNVEGPAFPYYKRVATQEFQLDAQGTTVPARPQPVRGTVHDENAWSLDGVSGHAGLFSTVSDTAKLCQMILNNGTYGGQRILEASTVDLIFTNFNAKLDSARSLGFELDKYATAGPMANLLTASHTGFTGTTIVIDRPSNTFYLHFANRVHPSRNWSSNGITRQALGYWVAKSLGREVEFPSLD
ncbi:hypothetical protein FQN55_002750 [Onygenales sp. PD_40]|nr:hypothetical protein FQN55_002750 [Onygenales sp. PD_40]KAK2783431.1 hypothetical protein FQN53_009194 [Emmonsiellopsis sp. PD_33]KAK2793394.1 hypothetical protein FQN52_001531 [Onygenales sp. PD_12]